MRAWRAHCRGRPRVAIGRRPLTATRPAGASTACRPSPGARSTPRAPERYSTGLPSSSVRRSQGRGSRDIRPVEGASAVADWPRPGDRRKRVAVWRCQLGTVDDRPDLGVDVQRAAIEEIHRSDLKTTLPVEREYLGVARQTVRRSGDFRRVAAHMSGCRGSAHFVEHRRLFRAGECGTSWVGRDETAGMSRSRRKRIGEYAHLRGRARAAGQELHAGVPGHHVGETISSSRSAWPRPPCPAGVAAGVPARPPSSTLLFCRAVIDDFGTRQVHDRVAGEQRAQRFAAGQPRRM